MAGSQAVTAVVVVVALWLVFLVSVSAAALIVQRRCYASNWQDLRERFPASVQLQGRTAWKKGFVRDSPQGGLLLFESKLAKGGILIRESNLLTFLHLLRPRIMYLPSDALHDARIVKVPLMKSLSLADWIEVAIDGSQVSILLTKDMWQRAFMG